MSGIEIPEELRARFERLMQFQIDVQEQVYRKLMEFWKVQAGLWLDKMLRSPADTVRQLQNPEPQIRMVALQILTDHWQLTESFASVCEHLVFHEANPHVRTQAIWSLARCYSKSDNARISNLLAGIVRNEQEADDIRLGAYEALLLVRVVRDLRQEACLRDVRLLQFPDDINWAIVDAFLIFR